MSSRRFFGVGVLVTVAAVVLVSTSPVIRAGTPSADRVRSSSSLAADPGLCLEVESSVLDAKAWREVLRAATVAVGQEPDFFPDGAIVSSPDLTRAWEPQGVDTVKIGIWGTGGDDPGSTDERRERLAGLDCLTDGSEWTVMTSHDLVLAAAELMLAEARLPQDGGEPLVPKDAEADIDVEFHPAEWRVRTILDWSKPVIGPIRVGGLCWIDDVLGADAGDVVVRSRADVDVTIGGEAGCALFQEFLDEKGAGERAVDLLPTEIALADGTVVRFAVGSVDLDGSAIVMAGSIEIG